MSSQDDQIAIAANSGDNTAVTTYLNENFHTLEHAARYLASGALDADDLLAEAILKLLELWRQNRGPTTNVNAYVVRSMRNRVIDEFRSPRSRVFSLPEDETQLPPVTDSSRFVDLHREIAIVRQALAKLTEDQQRVLQSTVIDGRKPADLETELARPASAIYALGRRARMGLRRATLQTVLEEDAPKECLRWVSKLPETATSSPDEAANSKGMTHIRECERCRAAWARFGAMGSALSICTVLAVATTTFPATSAQALEPRNAVPRATKSSPRAMGKPVRWLTRRWVATAAVAAISGGVVLIAISAPGIFNAPSDQATNESANEQSTVQPIVLVVTSHKVSSDSAELSVELKGVEGDSRVSLALPPGIEVRRTPENWECIVSSGSTDCRVSGTVSGVIGLFDARSDDEGRYLLTISTQINDRQLSGRAEGLITSEKREVSARVE